MTPPTDLVIVLRETGQRLASQSGIRDRDTLIGQLVVSAVELIPAADGGGISRTMERDVRTSHASDQVIYELDRLQDRLGEGPCITAAQDPPPEGIVVAHDLDGDDAARWPRFAPDAVRAGFRSILSTSLTSNVRARRRAALNLYSRTPNAFDADARTTAGLFAGQAAGLLFGADTAADLSKAVASRDAIGRAKGILMERFTVTDAAAFQMLVESSQNTNMKLVDVATWLNEQAEASAQST